MLAIESSTGKLKFRTVLNEIRREFREHLMHIYSQNKNRRTLEYRSRSALYLNGNAS